MLGGIRTAVLRHVSRLLHGCGSLLHRLAALCTPRLNDHVRPVLCFGDSITEGYHNIWPHKTIAPQRTLPANVNRHEHAALLCHPYSIRLGSLLADDVGDGAGGYKDSLRYARARAYSGWTAEELLPVLRRSLREGPWRCAVIMAGCNDILWRNASAATTLTHLEALYAACDEAGVPVVALSNTEADLGEFFSGEQLAERTAALREVAAGVLQMRSKRAVADVRAALPLGAQHFDDALHPSPAGSDRIAEAVFQAIKLHGL
mmetsp:Transcript_24551/g.76924  ORF Transcript_24551/g.76924 Transcript_24551/m.76924 type:complete len:261 (-) Transcript_24551:28-810(-)